MPNISDQDRVFAFFLITTYSIQFFCFEWKRKNHPLHLKILNSVCGWHFVKGWKDRNYDSSTGKVIVISNNIRQQVKELRDDFIHDIESGHKKEASEFYNTISSLADGEFFFVYRTVFSLPNQSVLFRIQTELRYINSNKTKDEADKWYDTYVDPLFCKYTAIQYIASKQARRTRQNQKGL